jgi:hypothetical protein
MDTNRHGRWKRKKQPRMTRIQVAAIGPTAKGVHVSTLVAAAPPLRDTIDEGHPAFFERMTEFSGKDSVHSVEC